LVKEGHQTSLGRGWEIKVEARGVGVEKARTWPGLRMWVTGRRRLLGSREVISGSVKKLVIWLLV
jgi:hypothetical protein